MKLLPFVFAIAILCTGCYSMPDEGVYSQIPTTNNPDVVGKNGGANWMPGAGF